ncbi:LytR/AlgR family response regulator transcription factor [Bacillus salipaludis]|uniref:LytTR family DNA-binding domain-containing protein n=1 Tax=Bacillus salipaludis TaxID=2547811 RepID=A0AA90TWI9_9BACI|nr:LytTR family DNA-binding domain-containing protein [Bacillus salipaludis]MDQ6600783.1 LytTR family DNA-binding domain-containing protein [Bacillus salipaludis]
MITAYLVEDEIFAREDLNDLLCQSNKIEVIGEADGIQKAIWEIHQLEPEVVFLDIHLAKGNGIELAKQLRTLKKPPFVVFVTAFDKYAVKAFSLDAVDYILKPFDEERIEQTIEKIVKWNQLKKEEDQSHDVKEIKPNITISKLAVVKDERILLVDIHNIMYVGTENRQVFIKTLNDKYLIDSHLYEIEQKLENFSFLRVHRGYIINLEYVNEIEQWFSGTYNIVFCDGYKVPVSRSYIKTVRKHLDF